MAVPKRKISKSKGRSRVANWKAGKVTLAECPKCHEMKVSHQVCPSCGYYDGRQEVAVEDKTAKAKKAN